MCDFDTRAGALVGQPHQVTNISTGADGQNDYRLDVSERFQLFTTLQRLKVPSKV